LDLKEIEPRPERLDRQLLEIMLSHHASGLEVIAAPNRPAEMRTFDPDMVTRLLDLVSSHFDYVVIDMPRTWFSWTDSVLLGSNRLFIVSEMTVPSIRQAKALVAAIRERLGDGTAAPRSSSTASSSDVRSRLRSDIDRRSAAICRHHPNNYRLVREAIDRGVRSTRSSRQQHHHATEEADAAAGSQAGRARCGLVEEAGSRLAKSA
jgi:pilus assembly protein CpaE